MDLLKDCITLDELDDDDDRVEEKEEKQEEARDDEGTATKAEVSCPTTQITAGALQTRRRCGPHVDSLSEPCCCL